jgi:hypothetical protein
MVDACYVYIKNFPFDFFMVFWTMFTDFGVHGVHHVLEYLIRSRVSACGAHDNEVIIPFPNVHEYGDGVLSS